MRSHRSLAGIVFGLTIAVAAVIDVGARTHDTGSQPVPRIVARVLPAMVSMTTRLIEREQFNQPLPTRASSWTDAATSSRTSTSSTTLRRSR